MIIWLECSHKEGIQVTSYEELISFLQKHGKCTIEITSD